MFRISSLILCLLPTLAGADDIYRIRFSQGPVAVQVRACFDGEAPAALYRNALAGAYASPLQANGESIRTGRDTRRVTLPELPPDACIEWSVDLDAAARRAGYRVAARTGEVFLGDTDLWFWRDGDRRAIRAEVELPSGYALSTPWSELGPGLYRVSPTPASWSSRSAVGRFNLQGVTAGDTTLRLAVLGDVPAEKRREMAAWIGEAAGSVASVYGRFPQSAPQVLVIDIGDQREPVPWAHVIRGGGPAVEFFVDAGRSLNEFRFDWTATHEFSHLLLPYVSARDRWLSEGLASYYQNVLQARDGRLTEERAWKKLDAGFRRGEQATRGGSLAEATRSGRGATMRVYWSGAAMMLKADSRLRSLSDGAQSLDSALERLADCCMQAGRIWRARDLMDELDRLTGYAVFSDLYRMHVPDPNFPDLESTYEKLGLVNDRSGFRLAEEAPWSHVRAAIMAR